MPHRTVSWTRIDRAGCDSRPQIPAGLLSARAFIQFGAGKRPLVVGDQYDRAAIMASAYRDRAEASGDPVAWRLACTEFDRLTVLSDAEYAALRIGDSFTLWTTEGVEAAQRGDLTRFSPREILAARTKTAAELADLLVIATRRDLQFAEARRQTSIRELYALAYPNGEDPETEPPETLVEAQPAAEILSWRGRGNVIAAAGVALLDLLDRERA